ncbi:MAG TPA: M20/M25/M40 family metallo-hydrolase [Gaiellaceae bacterium]
MTALRTGSPALPRPAGGTAPRALRARVSPQRLRADVEALARPRGRLHAPQEMARAEELVRASLEEAGWRVDRRPFTFHDAEGNLDHDPPEGDRRTRYAKLEGANLVATPKPCVQGRRIVVAAHLDTVPDSPGADDNASAVAALLELARVLDPQGLKQTPVLAILDMEEIGFFGARAFVQSEAPNTITGALVLESVGYSTAEPRSQGVPTGVGLLYRDQIRQLRRRELRGDWTLVVYRAAFRQLAHAVADPLAEIAGRDRVLTIREPLDFPLLGPILGRLVPWTREFARSDHVEFWRAGIPAVQITDTANFRNPNYHEPTDTPETLDYEYLADVVAATACALERLCSQG